MHILFQLPPPWSRRRAERGQLWMLPSSAIRVEIDPLEPLPADRRRWGERVLHRHLPEAGSIRQTEILDAVSHRGWPVTVVSTAALDDGGDPVESRITIFYEILYFGTALAARIPVAEIARWEESLRPDVVEAMLSIEPTFRGRDVAHVGELWDLAPSDEE